MILAFKIRQLNLEKLVKHKKDIQDIVVNLPGATRACAGFCVPTDLSREPGIIDIESLDFNREGIRLNI